MTTTLPYVDPGMGVPSFEVVDTYNGKFLLAGNQPELAEAVGMAQKVSTTLPMFQVVTYDATDGTIIAAVYDVANAYQAIGFTANASTVGSGGGNVNIFYQGCPNIDCLVWDASFDTDAKKLAAFRAAPTPTQIIAGKR
jgi:hypothetical protein